jgi:hypothetical protein
MSRYTAGRCTLNEENFSSIKEKVKPEIYQTVEKLGKVSEWIVSYGFDRMSCGWFIQFEKVTIDDFEGEQVVNLDSLFDKLNPVEFGTILSILFPNNHQIFSHSSLAFINVEF